MNFTRDAGFAINKIGTAFMMHPETAMAGAGAGLEFMEYYALGRGGVLGDVSGDVVASAFFFFEPNLVRTHWDAAKAKASPRDTSRHYADNIAAFGRKRFSDVDGIDDFAKNAQRVVEAGDARGIALFAGWRDMELPDDAAGRATVLIQALRELRGGANGIATMALGLTAGQAVAVNAPGMFPLFGWTGDMPNADDHRDQMAKAEDITDEICGRAFGVLSSSEQEAFLATANALHAAAEAG